MGQIGFPEMSVKYTTTGCVITQKNKVLSYFAAETCNNANADYCYSVFSFENKKE